LPLDIASEAPTNGGMSNVVAYLRVSTDRQAEEGFGLEVQEGQVRRWCDTHGHRLIAVYRDEGISGVKDTADRPGLAKALTALEGSAEIFIVARLDRLARALTDQAAVLPLACPPHGRVVAVDAGEIAPDDPDDPMRTAMRQMMGVFAQLDRAMVVARMRAGRRQKEAKGGYAGRGSPRLGQRSEAGELVADETEQATIARLVELADAGWSLRQIGAQLEGEGLTPKRGGQWHPTVIRRVLARVEPSEPKAA
jgi:DNA invertase Pin-like site-specific DNA recombinase